MSQSKNSKNKNRTIPVHKNDMFYHLGTLRISKISRVTLEKSGCTKKHTWDLYLLI